MVALVKLIADISGWLYFLLVVIALIIFRRLNLASKERARSIFDLERERATATINRQLFFLLVVLMVGGGIFYTSNILIEDVPIPVSTPTPTEIVQLPPTPTPPPLLPTPTPTPTAPSRPTPVIEVPEVVTVTEEPQAVPQVAPPNCPIPGAHITQPGNGATVSGVVSIIGAATIDNFEYYKIEFRVPGADWSFIESYNIPSGEGLIASWNSDTVPPGTYEFRLVVVDTTGNFPEPCQITLQVQ